MIQIEKGISIPPKKITIRPAIYPWDSMAVGDSFLAKTKTTPPAPKALIKRGWKFLGRVTPDGRARVWRVA
jgi:hypothetical protein